MTCNQRMHPLIGMTAQHSIVYILNVHNIHNLPWRLKQSLSNALNANEFILIGTRLPSMNKALKKLRQPAQSAAIVAY